MKRDLKKTNMENGIHYTLVGDYYFPTCTLMDSAPVIGKWAALYEQYLQEKHPHEYTQLIWSNRLNTILETIQYESAEKLERLIGQMAEAEGVNEELKAVDQLSWVQQMNGIRSRAEEIIIDEIMS